MPPVGIWIDGLIQSCTYMTMAFGMVLVFSILGILNWAHGQFYMLGAFVFYYAVTAAGIPFPVSLLISGVLVGGLGILVEKFIIERVNIPSAQGALYVTVATIALIFFFEGAASMIFGMQDKGLAMVLPGVLDLGSFSVSYQKIAVVIFTLVIMITMYIVLNHTKVGLAIRAAAQEPDAASLHGINVERLSLLVMGIGCALAAMAGSIMAPVFIINPFIGGIPMIMSLLAIVIGGLGSLTGAIVGGLILGFLNSVVAYHLSYFSEVVLFVLVIIILLVRPQGLFGASRK
ncbi:MAG: branched-chain amino acid ABC transporter permease [Desulfobacterales bacterium]|nr:MAG: branched-chain amino acid ABC transporter permease [Desulfobacterales bacterium]